MKGYVKGKPYYQANIIWLINIEGDDLLVEEFTTESEAIECIKEFRERWSDKDSLNCYVVHYDENGNVVDLFDV